MATFDTFADAPFQIKREGQEIVVRQARLSPTTIRVSWTFPSALTCNLPFVYNGAIVTLDEQPTSLQKLPSDGSLYTADPTADTNLHAGSKIGSAIVVGALYGDVLTNYVDIMDAPEGKAFYASVHAVDNVNRYHTDGVHSYSLPYGKEVNLPGAGYQMVFMGPGGVFGTSLTGLVPTTDYSFKLQIDGSTEIPITLKGSEATTYADLLNTINTSIAVSGLPIISANRPANYGSYFVNTTQEWIKQYNGIGYDNINAPVFFTPLDPLLPNTGDYWFDTKNNTLNVFDAGWNQVTKYAWPRDPRQPYCNDYWFDEDKVRKWNGAAWIEQTLIISKMDPTLPPMMTCAVYWVHEGKVYQWDEKTCSFLQQASTTAAPVSPEDGQLHLDVANEIVNMWSDVDQQWVNVHAIFSETDPSLAKKVSQGTVWLDDIMGILYKLDGTSWVMVSALTGTVKPQNITDGAHWFNTTNQKWHKLNTGLWKPFTPMSAREQPNIPVTGAMWYQHLTHKLFTFDGSVWNEHPFTTNSVIPNAGTKWYNPSNGELRVWTDKIWALASPSATVSLNELGNIKFTSGNTGSRASVCIIEPGNLWDGISLTPSPRPQQPMKGTDPLSSVPSYQQVGVGTDGSQDERRELVSRIKSALGYPVMQVELTKDQMDLAINMALEKLRAISSAPYRRGYFALDLQPRVQKYVLTNETVGHNTIADILYVYRASGSYISTAAGNDVYGQMMIQSLFTMGKFDLLSHHMMTQYSETMRQVFATEIQHSWNEHSRELTIYKDLPRGEKVLVDAMVERTEQDLMSDRWTRPWIQKYATAQCRYMLAEIRGKFTNLPGAGGSVTLNGSELRAAADKEVQECIDDVDNFSTGGKSEFGLSSDFVIG